MLARLARSDVVALRDREARRRYPEELKQATQRVVDQCRDLLVHVDRRAATNAIVAKDAAARLLELMIEHLGRSRLTINFKASSWFYTRNRYASYANFFERGTSGASNDRDARNRAEMDLGRYGGQRYRGGNPSPEEQVAIDRIATYGLMDQDGFQPRMRPRYAALDFAGARYGGCSKYGHSYFVLHEHMKANATFCHMDSFTVTTDLRSRANEYRGPAPTLESSTSTYGTMGRLLLYCKPEQLREIAAYAVGQKRRGVVDKVFGGLLYLEAHLHADVQFDRDVQYVMIARGKGLENGIHPLARARWPFKKTVWDARDEDRMIANAKRFGRDHHVTVLLV